MASILDRFDEQDFARGDLILEQDQPMEHVYLLRTGRVKIATTTESGRTVIHYIIRPGDAFGVLNAFLGGDARYFVEALEAVAVSVIPLGDFLALLSDHPKLANGVGRVLGTRLLESLSNVERLAFQDTRSRFIAFLTTAAAESGRRVRNGIEVRTGLRHRDSLNFWAPHLRTSHACSTPSSVKDWCRRSRMAFACGALQISREATLKPLWSALRCQYQLRSESSPRNGAAPLYNNTLLEQIWRADARVANLVSEADLSRGTVIATEGASSSTVFFPVTCALSISVQVGDGRSCEVATIGNEGMDLNGLEASKGGTAFTAEHTVTLAGKAYRASAEAIRSLLLDNEDARRFVDRFALGLVSQLVQTAACNRLHSVEQRSIRRLLRTSDHAQSAEFLMTHESLASILGASRVTVTRVLYQLASDGLIESPRGQIKIVDRNGLESLSCECYQVIKTRYQQLLL